MIIRQDGNQGDSRQIKASNFGGLNTYAAPDNIPYNDSPVLLNVDVLPNGKVSKRRGTRIIYKETVDFPIFTFQLNTNNGIPFIIAKKGFALSVLQVVNDEASVVWQRDSVFTDAYVTTYVVNLPGKIARVLFLTESHVPIQISVYERTRINFSGSTLTFLNSGELNSSETLCYVDNVLTEGVTYSVTNNDITVTLPTSVSNQRVDIIRFTWQWWAEALHWYGENFFRGVSRYGASRSDQHIQVPDTIFSDRDEKNLYLVDVYQSTNFNDFYIESTTQQPRTQEEYSWSDAVDYQYSPTKFIKKSPLFITFGKEASLNTIELTDRDVEISPSSSIVVPNHNFVEGDIVRFVPEDGAVLPSPFVANIPYYVGDVTDGAFRLYSDPGLTTLVVINPRGTLAFTDVNVDPGINRFFIIGHGLTNGMAVRYESSLVPIIGLSTDVTYYIRVIDANYFYVCFDPELTRIVNISPRAEYVFDCADVSPFSVITVPSHLQSNNNPVRFRAINDLPVGLAPFTRYYVYVLTPNEISVLDSPGGTLITLSPGFNPGFLIEDGGDHLFRVDGGKYSIERFSDFTSVYFSRTRQLPFNGDKGILPTNLQVYVNQELATRGLNLATSVATPGYFVLQQDATTLASNTDFAKYINFQAGSLVGVERIDRVELVNIEPKWIGIAASTNRATKNDPNGGWVPIYGIGQFADYGNGYFPSIGVLFQGRLVLSGLKQEDLTLVFSSVSDTMFENEYFNFFQITDDLSAPESDPFDVLLPVNPVDSISSLLNYQSSLFVFTRESVFRTFSSSTSVTSTNRLVGLVANQGAINRLCVVATEASIFFLSKQGFFDLNVAVEGEYRAAEVSLKIRDQFEILNNTKYSETPWVSYDKTQLRVFVALPVESTIYNSRLLVFDPSNSSWSEYQSYEGFKSYSGMPYYDLRLGQLFLISCLTRCNKILLRFNYPKLADFIELIPVGYTLPLAGIPPVFEVIQTFNNVLVYPVSLPIVPILDYEDIAVRVGPNILSLTLLTFGVDYEKTYSNHIKLLSNPGVGVIVVQPLVMFHNWGDNVEETLAPIQPRSYDNPCSVIPPGS